MCPAFMDTEVLDSPHQFLQKKMEDKLFPPISRKSTLSMTTSEPDTTDFYNKHERVNNTRGSMPASLSGSPIKFPTIDRSNSTSVASLPGSRAARHRSQGRDLRSSYCRSPSCPSNLDRGREFSHMEFAIFNRQVQSDRSRAEIGSTDDLTKEEKTKLPNIFSKDINAANLDISKNVLHRNKPHDVTNVLSLRRSESFKNALNSTSESRGSYMCHDGDQPSPRQNQTAALLLPIRTDSKVNNRKKKKTRRSRVRAESDSDTNELTPHSISNLDGVALEAIARENRHTCSDDDEIDTPRAIEINSSRRVKKWMNENKTAQKGEIKA